VLNKRTSDDLDCQLNIRLKKSLLAKLKTLAKLEDMSLNLFLNLLFEETTGTKSNKTKKFSSRCI
jgi:hypothetical protein